MNQVLEKMRNCWGFHKKFRIKIYLEIKIQKKHKNKLFINKHLVLWVHKMNKTKLFKIIIINNNNENE